jgi:hypothetical protein
MNNRWKAWGVAGIPNYRNQSPWHNRTPKSVITIINNYNTTKINCEILSFVSTQAQVEERAPRHQKPRNFKII